MLDYNSKGDSIYQDHMCGAKSSKIGPVGAGEAVILNRDDSWSLLNVHAPSFITGQSMIIIMVILIAACYFCIRNRRRA